MSKHCEYEWFCYDCNELLEDCTCPQVEDNNLLKKIMSNHYFTFGQSHVQNDGTPMKDYWVRVVCDDAGNAREKFVTAFTIPFMPSPDKFAFQYDDNDFKPEYFPGGEYLLIQ